MDDIAVNPESYDLFREPALLALTATWFALIFIFRFVKPRVSEVLVYLGGAILVFAALVPVIQYTIDEVPLLIRQTKTQLETGSADTLRERDPIFGLVKAYRTSDPGFPLAVVSQVEDPETIKWAAYYLYPRPVVRTTVENLANAVPERNEPPRFVLAKGTPALPADVDVTIESRLGDWVLFTMRPAE